MTPDEDMLGLTARLPDVPLTPNRAHLGTRYPARVRVENAAAELFRVSKSAVVVFRGH